MIVASLALLTERHGEASKEVKMRHQYLGKFFVKIENKNQNHQNSNLHHLYIAEILTKLRAIYDATVWKGIVARFKISDTPFLECPTGLYGTLRERFSRDAITQQSSQQSRAIYDATVMRSITTRFRNGIASIYIQEAKERDAISDRRDCFFAQTAIISVQEGMQRKVTSDTPDGTLRDRFFARTQKSWPICDATVCKALDIGNATTLHPMLSMTERHQARYFIYDAMS